MRLSLIGPSYPAFSHAVSVQQSLNIYPETVEAPEGKTKQVLRGRPGWTLLKDLTTIHASAIPIRGMWAGGGRLFVAAGDRTMELDITGSLVGAVRFLLFAPGTTPVDIIPNGNQLLYVADGRVHCDNGAGPNAIFFTALSGKVSTSGTAVTWQDAAHSAGWKDKFDVGFIGQQINIDGVLYTVESVTSPDLLHLTTSAGVQVLKDYTCQPIMNAARAAFMDGYYIAARPISRQFNTSKHLDGITWPGLDYDYKEGFPDNLRAVWAEPPLLYLLGTETLEIWRNTGKSGGTPFERIDGGFARVGLAATWSPTSIFGRLHMLAGGSRGHVSAVRMEGVTPVRISSYGLEEALKAAAFPNVGWSYTYEDRGHVFWVIYFGTGSSWVFDATEAQRRPPQECWHQRATWDGAAFQAYTPAFHAFIPEWNGGTHIVGDAASGKLYAQSSDTFNDAGAAIRYVRTLGYVYAEGRRVYHHRLEVEMETGQTNPVPTVELDWSDDRGETWGTGAGVGTKMTMGPQVVGAYTTRFFAAALGSSRGRVYRLTITGKGRVAIIDATLDMTEGLS